jgi:precorrin-6Y C5,15-methyltransferase (decarboxylating)
MVSIVGLGPGNQDYILPVAIKTLEKVHVIVGFERAIEAIAFIKKEKKQVSSLKETLQFIKGNLDKDIAIVASGDPGFYGIQDYISKNIDEKLTVIPGISSFQYFFAKLNKNWQNSYLGSLHGRDTNFLEIIKKEKVSFWLTDKINTPNFMAQKLMAEGIKGIMYVGEDLSYATEKISEEEFETIAKLTFSELSVVIVERKED